MQRICTTLLAFAAVSVLGGCAVTIGEGSNRVHYFGWVSVPRMMSTDADSPVLLQSTKVLGMRFNPGVMLGYANDQTLLIRRECVLIVVVKNVDEYAEFARRSDGVLRDPLLCVGSIED
jgi:hypothetical protein